VEFCDNSSCNYVTVRPQVPHFSFSRQQVLALVPKCQQDVGEFANYHVLLRCSVTLDV